MTISGPSQRSMFGDGSPTQRMWPTPDTLWRPHEGNVRLLRRQVEAGQLSEQEAEAILGKSVWQAQGKFPASTSSAAASPASRSASPASNADRMIPAISGLPLLDWLPISGPVGCVLRTLAGSSAWRSTICSLTWTVSATPRGRWLFRLRASARSTAGTGSGSSLIGTPTAAMKHRSTEHAYGRAKNPKELANMAARMWPTPQHRDHITGEACRLEQPNRHGAFNLNDQIAATTGQPGKLNPDFVCRLMGFPDGWLDLT